MFDGRIFRNEAIGAVFIILTGSALHFVFDWAGRWPPVAVVAAVNESIWEHLKLAFWPGLVWAVVTCGTTTRGRAGCFAIRGFALLVAPVLIVTIFTGYTAILGDNLLVLDIGTFVLAVMAGQVVAAGLLSCRVESQVLIRLGLGLLTALLIAFSLFSFFPPDHWLFVDPGTGLRGMDAR